MAALFAALLWALFADDAPAPEPDPEAVPRASEEPGPTSTQVEAPAPTGKRGASPSPKPSASATPSLALPSGKRHQATIEIEVRGASRAVQVFLSWPSRDAQGHEESLFSEGETGTDSVATFAVAWGGLPKTRVQVRVHDERGRGAYLEFTLEAGATRRERVELPLTPILEVRKPLSQGLDMQGSVSIYVGEELREGLGVFAERGDVAVMSPLTKGRCRVVVRARLFEKTGDLAGWVHGEREVELQAGVRTLVTPNYVPMASLRVRVLRPDGTPLSATLMALRCAAGPRHDCQAEHQGEPGGRGGGLSFADDEEAGEGEAEEGEEPAPVADPAPLLKSQLGEEVFLAPGVYEVLASGNDPSLGRGVAQVVVKAGARRVLELRLPKGRDVEVRLPEATSDELDFVIEGPPAASARLESGRTLRIRGLLESDWVRVRARRWVGEEIWGEQVLLAAGARHNLRLARTGSLELRLRRPDGSQSDLEGGVSPETPEGLGRYQIALSEEEEDPPTWFEGDRDGHWGRVTHEISSILDAFEDEGVYTIQLLPGKHWVHVKAPSGAVRIPITVEAGQTVRVDRVIK